MRKGRGGSGGHDGPTQGAGDVQSSCGDESLARDTLRFGEHVLGFEMRGDDLWRVLIDGRPIPMTLATAKTSVSGSGHWYETKTEPSARDGVPLGPAMRSSAEWELRLGPPVVLCCAWRDSFGMYNTVFYESYEARLTLAEDLSAVAIELKEHSDGST